MTMNGINHSTGIVLQLMFTFSNDLDRFSDFISLQLKMSHVCGKMSFFFFLYLNFIPGLMFVTFLFLKYLDTPTVYFIRIGRLIWPQNLIDKYFERILNITLNIMIIFSILRMKTNWILHFFFVQIQHNSYRLGELYHSMTNCVLT